ncbi:MAG: DUF4388 domain-containing protein [Planctomycetes bacterium]|nr:DUF4388 domain-containing protein [Planctomycetota bacterium]
MNESVRAPAGQPRPGGRDVVRGDLAEQGLPDLLQYLERLGRDGQLIVESRRPLRRSGGVYFRGGRIVHAHCPPHTGAAAVHAMLVWTDGRFAFVAGARPEHETVTASVTALVLDGLRRKDELTQLTDGLPPLDAPLHQGRDALRLAGTRISLRAVRLFALIDGRRTVGELIDAAGDDAVAVASDLQELVHAGLATREADVTFLAGIVLRRLAAEHRQGLHCRAPSEFACHVLRESDGRRSLSALLDDLGCGDQDLIDTVRELVVNRWLEVGEGHELYARYLG